MLIKNIKMLSLPDAPVRCKITAGTLSHTNSALGWITEGYYNVHLVPEFFRCLISFSFFVEQMIN